jgi:predicted dehydrogenase
VEGPEMTTQWKRPLEYWDGWRGLWSTAYGGVLTSHGIHMIDLAIVDRGMPDKVSCTLDMTQPGVAVETQATVGLHYKKHDPLTIKVKAGPDLEQEGFNLGTSFAGYINLFVKIHKTLTEDAPPPVTLEDARNALEVLTAAYYSAYSGKVVTLPIRNDHPFYAGWHEAFAQRVRQQHTPSPASQKIHG